MIIKAGQWNILKRCREAHGVDGALEEAIKLIRKQYKEVMTHEANKDALICLKMTIGRKEDAGE